MNAPIISRKETPIDETAEALERNQSDEDGQAAPRPPSAEDIADLLAKAERAASGDPKSAGEAGIEIASSVLLWGGVGVAALAAAYILASDVASFTVIAIAVLGLAIAGLIAVGALRARRNELTVLRPVNRERGANDGSTRLVNIESLADLNIVGDLLDADADARLVTTPDGIVTYANKKYAALAEEADVIGVSGLPPRIDRLFSERGADATKIFKLCRAAKSQALAQEVIHQKIGFAKDSVRRCFEVTTYPVGRNEPHAAWRIRELPVDVDAGEAFEASYTDLLDPVIAIERSGQIVWSNPAAAEKWSLDPNSLSTLDDLVLGDTQELTARLWECDRSEQPVNLRAPGGNAAEGTLTAFRRGGVGDGVVYLAIAQETLDCTEVAPTEVAGELTEAPFGFAIVEGEFGRDARVVETNQVFQTAFDNVKKGVSLSRIIPNDTITELVADTKRKSSTGPLRAVDAVIGEGSVARTFSVYAKPLKRKRGGYGKRRTFLYTVEVTDQKRMQEDHFQDQKLKAIGHIAGEVAHDFNNLLQVVLSSCEDLLLSHPAGDPAYSDLLLIRQNAQRAANLTRQLLAYSRKQTLTSLSLSMTDLLVDFSRFLDRAVGEKVKIELKNGRNLPSVKVDRNQFENALMNLAVNARDAMVPDGGMIKIATQRLTGTELASHNLPQLRESDHLLITVSDTGPGVPDEIIDKIFDPFFTTKEEGKGTGLGLSAVQGLIVQMGGAITVENRTEGGATFRIYLPAAEEEEKSTERVKEEKEAPAAADAEGRRFLRYRTHSCR